MTPKPSCLDDHQRTTGARAEDKKACAPNIAALAAFDLWYAQTRPQPF